MTGRMLNERLGKWHFWLFLIGFHLTFDFMHIPGMLGMPRQIYTYEADRGWEIWNLIVSIGGLIQAIAIRFSSITWCTRTSKAPGRSGSLGCLDAGVGDPVAAAGVQLCDRAGRYEPPSAMGPEAPGRPGLSIRRMISISRIRQCA